jgi:hypothetical protein
MTAYTHNSSSSSYSISNCRIVVVVVVITVVVKIMFKIVLLTCDIFTMKNKFSQRQLNPTNIYVGVQAR